METLKKSIEVQRASLRNMLVDPMRRIAEELRKSFMLGIRSEGPSRRPLWD